MLRIVSFLSVLIFSCSQMKAQSCCSGGVPIASNLGFGSAEKKVLQLSFNLDYNKLTSLFSNSDRLDDDLTQLPKNK